MSGWVRKEVENLVNLVAREIKYNPLKFAWGAAGPVRSAVAVGDKFGAVHHNSHQVTARPGKCIGLGRGEAQGGAG